MGGRKSLFPAVSRVFVRPRRVREFNTQNMSCSCANLKLVRFSAQVLVWPCDENFLWCGSMADFTSRIQAVASAFGMECDSSEDPGHCFWFVEELEDLQLTEDIGFLSQYPTVGILGNPG